MMSTKERTNNCMFDTDNWAPDKCTGSVLEDKLPWLFQRNFSSAELQGENERKYS